MTSKRRRRRTRKGERKEEEENDDNDYKEEEEGDEREHKERREENREGGEENRCSCQSQDTIVDHGPLQREKNKVTSSVYMRVCASTYGTKEKEKDIKRVRSEKANEEQRAMQRDGTKVR